MKNNKILILEDEILVALDLQELLEAAGYQTKVAHKYSDALALLDKFSPELAICDINLGKGASGIDFATDAKQLLPKLEIIYVTAFSTSDMVEAAEDTNPFNYIVKPWNEEQIKVTVKIAFNYLNRKIQQHPDTEKLSLAEYRIVELIAQQKTSKQIADILYITEKTVSNHRYRIVKKLQLPNDNNNLLKWAITHFKQ
jgi:DNA-binding NarL/FixJ family response regulator